MATLDDRPSDRDSRIEVPEGQFAVEFDGDQIAVPATVSQASVVSSYQRSLFVDHPEWTHTLRILNQNGGGSFGVSGPRGAGKTWLMLNACEWAIRKKERKGIGVWFPSPSEYDPMAFLASISEVLAVAFEEWHDQKRGTTTTLVRRRYNRRVLAGFCLTYLSLLLIALIFEFSRSSLGGLFLRIPLSLILVYVLLIAAAIAGIWFAVRARKAYKEARDGIGRVRARAEEVRQQVKFAVNLKDSAEASAEAGRWGIKAALKKAYERQLVERPATLSTFVQNFRILAEQIAAAVAPEPLIICVDELDKMSDSQRVTSLLRDIKGVFDVRGVHFFVSISDEAARSLELGSVKTRNEFNSAFYTVLHLSPFDPNLATALLVKRAKDFPECLPVAISILGSGIPREIVRLAESANAFSLRDALLMIADQELESFWTELLYALPTTESGLDTEFDSDKSQVVQLIGNGVSRQGQLLSFPLAAWTLDAGSKTWKEQFQEEWRRILVRLCVILEMATSSEVLENDRWVEELHNVVRATAGSSHVGRLLLIRYVLARYLRLPLPPTLTDPQAELLFTWWCYPARTVTAKSHAVNAGLTITEALKDLRFLESLGVASSCHERLAHAWRLNARLPNWEHIFQAPSDGPGKSTSPPASPGSTHSNPADQQQLFQRSRRNTTGSVEPRPSGTEAGPHAMPSS